MTTLQLFLFIVGGFSLQITLAALMALRRDGPLGQKAARRGARRG